jgi:hypothetical protein
MVNLPGIEPPSVVVGVDAVTLTITGFTVSVALGETTAPQTLDLIGNSADFSDLVSTPS